MVNDNSNIVNKLGASLTDDARVIIYNHQMFTVQASGFKAKKKLFVDLLLFLIKR